MASTSVTQLIEQLGVAGVSLLRPPSSVEELLALLDQAEDLLVDVDQAPPQSIKDALLPMMKALKSDALLKHPEAVVRVSAASCIHEIARITAPLEPYDDQLMKEIFKLTVSSFEKLSQPSTRCYEKAASIVFTIARVRSCVMMLDLECDDLVIEMFHHFLENAGSYHTEDVLWAMERIMTLVLEESEVISMELLEPLLASVLKENEDVAPISWKLGESVISNCAKKLRPILKDAVQSARIALDKYAPVITSICGSSSDNSEQLCANGSQELGGGEVGAKSGSEAPIRVLETPSAEDSSGKLKSSDLLDSDGPVDLGLQSDNSRKRDRKPNSLMNPEEGYEPFWELRDSKCHQTKPYESPKPEDYRERKQRRFPRKNHNAARRMVDSSETVSDEEGELLVSCELRQPSIPLNREGESSSVEMGSKRKKCISACDKKKPEVSGKKKAGKSASASSVMDGVQSKRTSGAGPKRKQAPRKEKGSDQQDVGEEVVGRTIKVWWPHDKVFYDGIVRSYDRKRKRHQVLYNDGVEERLNLKKQRWKLVEDEMLPDEDTAKPKHELHDELPEVLCNLKKKKKSKSTKDPNPYRLVKRAGALSSLTKIEPSDGHNEDEPVIVDTTVGSTVSQIGGTEVEDAKTSQTEQNPNLSCSEGPEA